MKVFNLFGNKHQRIAKTNTEIVALAKPRKKEAVLYGGVSMEELRKIALSCYHVYCLDIDGGLLRLNFTSRSGKTRRHVQLSVTSKGKLQHYGGYYPNEYRTAADEFAEKVNAQYTFSGNIIEYR